ncbi:peroxisome assembly protein (Peroxin-2) [Geranomyces variabilis]|uniref:RING-type E3 ubiquitin transferase (cysteine targeting) n=1 Tax=Geranomyces variabilis TaxID=109894 RepID=A0AAD5TH30_9FUNG|nr:peroxisome assembly protein (Peroxin-2) [Geranomyces variabilis]
MSQPQRPASSRPPEQTVLDASRFWLSQPASSASSSTSSASNSQSQAPAAAPPPVPPAQNLADFAATARKALAAYRSPALNVLRVSQMDAELLDAELTTIVKNQLVSMFTFFKRDIKDTYDPEITAVLQYIMCHLSIYSMGASYGLQLQNLKYRNEARHQGRLEISGVDAPLSMTQKVLHALFYIGGRWGVLRINRYATAHEWSEEANTSWRNRLWRYMQKAETAYKALSLLNFLAFLYNGRYRSLLDRLLRMRLVYRRRETARQVSFEFMNRQLVWHAFTEFLLFLVPLINVERVKNTITRAISGPVTVDLPDHICAICHAEDRPKTTIHTPYVTDCGHVYCYYCIKTSIMADHAFPCPRCGATVHDIQRVAPHVKN